MKNEESDTFLDCLNHTQRHSLAQLLSTNWLDDNILIAIILIGVSGGNQRKHSVSSKRMGKMSSLSIVTMIGLIITTIVALSCLNAYRKLSAPISHTSTLTTQAIKVVDTDKPQVQLKSLTDSELLIDSKSNKEKEQEKERDKYKEQEQEKEIEKERNQDKKDKMLIDKFKEEEISDENMELIEKETKKTKTNLRQGVQKDFLKNEDRKIYQELNLFISFICFLYVDLFIIYYYLHIPFKLCMYL